MFQSYLPLLVMIVIGAAYTVSYLMIQSRKNEYAIMRMLGMNKRSCFLQFMLEYLLIVCVGGLVGTVISMIFWAADLLTACLILGAFVCCYLCGILIALKNLDRKALITLFAQKE